MTDVDLGPKQLLSVTESNGSVNLWEGSIRSGKTIASLLRWLLFVNAAPRGGELVMVGRTRDAIFRNVLKPMQDDSLFGSVASQVVYTNGASTAQILGRTVHIIGASDAKAEKVIRGMTVAGCYIDEVTVIPEEFFTQLLGRMSVAGAQMFGTTNPDSPAFWLKLKFLDRIAKLPTWRTWHFVMDDNPTLSDEYKAAKRLEFTGLWYQRFILGLWVAAEGAIYSSWDPAKHVVPFDSLPPMRRILSVGVDHGTTNPSAGILIGLGDDNRLYAIDEWYLDGGAMQVKPTIAYQSESLRSWLAERPAPQFVCADPAAAGFRTQLAYDHVANVVNADNDVAYGIPVVASLLGSGQLLISDRCTNLIREIPGYAWDPKATVKGEDKPIKVADHCCDALRYGLVTTESLWRDSIASPVLH